MEQSQGKMSGKICMVTGANGGIGYVTALELAKMGATVVLVCRNKSKGEAARSEIQTKSGNQSVDLLLADLSSQKSIRQLAEDFKSKYQHLHVLVNNAGAAFGQRTVTEDGLESTFAMNHLGYFLLTVLLLDVLKASAPSRIVNVSSSGHQTGRIDFDDLQEEKKRYNTIRTYCNSKLANVLFTYELAKRLEGTGVTANCLHPGVVATNFGMGSGGLLGLGVKIARPFEITPEQGARTSIYLASSPDVEGVTGKYFAKCKERSSAKQSHDEATGQRLWQVSEQLTHISEQVTQK